MFYLLIILRKRNRHDIDGLSYAVGVLLAMSSVCTSIEMHRLNVNNCYSKYYEMPCFVSGIWHK